MPDLAADENFSPFFAFIAKTRPKPPFGIPRALPLPQALLRPVAQSFAAKVG